MAITTKEMTVTPDLAIKWLEGNVHNRKVRDSVVSRYARDMKAGRWRLTHQGIAFDKSEADPAKCLLDGQHRLYAIVEAGVNVRLMVSFNVPADAQGVIDDNLPRTMVDTMKLVEGREDVTATHVAIAKRLLGNPKQGRLSRQEVVTGMEQHATAIAFAIEAFPRIVRGITTATVMTVVARASYTVDHDRLGRFAEALTTGQTHDDEQPILMLRNWLLEKAPRRGGSMSMQDTIYGKTERALYAYLDGERLSILYAADKELFPLPAEAAARRPVAKGGKKPKR